MEMGILLIYPQKKTKNFIFQTKLVLWTDHYIKSSDQKLGVDFVLVTSFFKAWQALSLSLEKGINLTTLL